MLSFYLSSTVHVMPEHESLYKHRHKDCFTMVTVPIKKKRKLNPPIGRC